MSLPGNGAFEFREYLAVIGVLTRGHPEADCVRILFEICDRDGDHVVYKPEMLHVRRNERVYCCVSIVDWLLTVDAGAFADSIYLRGHQS